MLICYYCLNVGNNKIFSLSTIVTFTVLAIIGVLILISSLSLKGKQIYKSKASDISCKDGIISVSTNISGEIISQGSGPQCRVLARDQGVTNIACGYFVNDESWPRNCPWSSGGKWEGSTAVFPCNPDVEGISAGSTIKFAASRDGSCWTNKDMISGTQTYYYISKSQATPTPTVQAGAPTPTPTAVGPQATPTPVVGYCDKSPKAVIPTAVPGYKWTALCDKPCTVATVDTDCPRGENDQQGWCYGFDAGFKCLRFDSATAGSPTVIPTPTATLTPSPTQAQSQPTATPTLTPTPSGSVTLNLKLKFQGIAVKPQDEYNQLVVKVTLTGGQVSGQAQQSATFTSDNNGVWSGRAVFTAQTGASNKYAILIKGPKHIQKKICIVNPRESEMGAYSCSINNIVLTEGVNNLDFTGVTELVGDLPEQDGIVNSSDITTLINLLGRDDEDSLQKADLNLDGVVNTFDFGLMLNALKIKTDES